MSRNLSKLMESKADASTVSDLQSRISELEEKAGSDTNSQKKSNSLSESVATNVSALLMSAVVGSVALFQLMI